MACRGVDQKLRSASSQCLIRFFWVGDNRQQTTETANGVLRITNRFKIQAVLQLLQSIVTFTIITLAFFLKWGFFEILVAYFAGKLVIGTGPAIAALKAMHDDFGRDWLFRNTHTKVSLRETLQFAVSTNLSATTKLLASESEPLWLGYFLNENAVGLFKVAMSVVNLITIPSLPLFKRLFRYHPHCGSETMAAAAQIVETDHASGIRLDDSRGDFHGSHRKMAGLVVWS
jgi:hypothetical protein